MRTTLSVLLVASCASANGRRIGPVTAVVAVGASAVIGFGAGQAVEGEWSTRGWAFAVADAGFVASCGYALRGLAADGGLRIRDTLAFTSLWVGVLGLIGSHLWQAHDSATGPGRQHHAIVRALSGAPETGRLRQP